MPNLVRYPSRRWMIGLVLWTIAAAVQAAPFAYVSNQNDDSVSVIDLAADTVVATIGVGVEPRGIAMNPAGTRVYVAHQSGITVIDGTTQTRLTTIPVVGDPIDVAVLPAGNRVYAVGAAARSVWSIDAASNTVLGTIALPADGASIAANRDGSRVFVTRGGDALTVISTATDTIALTIPLPAPVAIAVDTPSDIAYVSSPDLDQVRKLDLSSGATLHTYDAVASAYGLAVHPAGRPIYAASYADAVVQVLDGASGGASSIVAGPSLFDIAVDARRRRLMTTNFDHGTVTFVPLAGGTPTTLAVGEGPSYIALRADPVAFADGFE